MDPEVQKGLLMQKPDTQIHSSPKRRKTHIHSNTKQPDTHSNPKQGILRDIRVLFLCCFGLSLSWAALFMHCCVATIHYYCECCCLIMSGVLSVIPFWCTVTVCDCCLMLSVKCIVCFPFLMYSYYLWLLSNVVSQVYCWFFPLRCIVAVCRCFVVLGVNCIVGFSLKK